LSGQSYDNVTITLSSCAKVVLRVGEAQLQSKDLYRLASTSKVVLRVGEAQLQSKDLYRLASTSMRIPIPAHTRLIFCLSSVSPW